MIDRRGKWSGSQRQIQKMVRMSEDYCPGPFRFIQAVYPGADGIGADVTEFDYGKLEERLMAKTTSPQFNFRDLRSPDFHKNAHRLKGSEQSCILCGKPVPKPKYFVWEHLGGGVVVTREEGERLNHNGHEHADLGAQPIGSDCLRKHPELKPYIGAI